MIRNMNMNVRMTITINMNANINIDLDINTDIDRDIVIEKTWPIGSYSSVFATQAIPVDGLGKGSYDLNPRGRGQRGNNHQHSKEGSA